MRRRLQNLSAIPFALARWWVCRSLRRNRDLWIGYHANVAVQISDHGLEHSRSQLAADAIMAHVFAAPARAGASE